MNIKEAVLQLEIQTKGDRKYKLLAQHKYVDIIFIQSDSSALKKQLILGVGWDGILLVAAFLDVSLLAKAKTSFYICTELLQWEGL